jgi:hypothetical protein
MVRLWADDGGALIAAEWVFVATILVLGAITGLVAVRQAVIAEVLVLTNALLSPNQSFNFSGQSNCESSSAGWRFIDNNDSIVVRSTFAIPRGFDNRACD